MTGQSIRPSQFITTYGPGAILEGPRGPRIVLSLEHSGVFRGRPPSSFDITDPRLSAAVLGGATVVRLPSNAEHGEPDSEVIYRTAEFPAWSLCLRHRILYNYTTYGPCPQCRMNHGPDAWKKSRLEAIRFVRACPVGHLDDVDWISLAHRTTPHQGGPPPDHLLWDARGGSLREINVTCPTLTCGASMNMGLAYGMTWRCNGRLPETRRPALGRCDREAAIIQRGAANLRVSEILSAITIPPLDTPLHRLLGKQKIRNALQGIIGSGGQIASKEQVIRTLEYLAGRHEIPETDAHEVGTYTDEEVVRASNAVVVAHPPSSVQSLRDQELDQLAKAAEMGAPAVPSRTPGMPPLFEVIASHVQPFPGPTGRVTLRVTPVSRLQVTMVQRGYRRVIGDNPAQCHVVEVALENGNERWYPGVELFGEGIFLDLFPSADSTPIKLLTSDRVAEPWMQAWRQAVVDGEPEEEAIRRHPEFIWWHTLAHRIMNALSVDSGYSSAAVRERVYLSIDSNGQTRGGVLLYTAQPGGDGTLGGLISLVPRFDRVLSRAFLDIDACSNDPLCEEERFGPGRANGAACYACLLVSETSCEFRNTSLDRNVLLENLP